VGFYVDTMIANILELIFTTEPSAWPARCYKYILQKVLCLLAAYARHRRTYGQTDRQTDGKLTSIAACSLRNAR